MSHRSRRPDGAGRAEEEPAIEHRVAEPVGAELHRNQLTRRRLLAGSALVLGGAATAWAARIGLDPGAGPGDRAAGTVADVRDHGARGNGTTDDAAAIQAAIDTVFRAGGGTVLIPAGTYRTLTGILHRPGVTVRGAGKNATRIRNDGHAGSFADAIAWHFGTYGPGDGPQAVQREAGYALVDSAAGASVLTLVRPSDSARFSVGDYVSWEGGTNDVATAPRVPNGVARVTAVNSGSLRLDRPVVHALRSDAAPPTVRRLNTGALTGDVGDSAWLASHAGLRELTVQQTADGYPAINLACVDSVIEDVATIGYMSLSGNPVARCQFRRLEGRYRHGAVEFAYMSHDNQVERCRWVRYGEDADPDGAIGVWMNSGEGARDSSFTGCEVIDVTSHPSSSGHAAVELSVGSAWIGGRVVAGRAGGVYAYGDDIRVSNATISTSVGDAIQLGGSRIEVTGNQVDGIGADGSAIHASVYCSDCSIQGNTARIGGSRSSDRLVLDEGTHTTVRRNDVSPHG